MDFTKEQCSILNNYVSNTVDNIYAIYGLPPEVVAVLFAYYSRSPASFRENLLKLLEQKDLDLSGFMPDQQSMLKLNDAKEKARKFHEKWVVGYGHGSVAEHANASVAIENVSLIATKIIEDNRLASYTEKSTRYQVFDKTRYYTPKNISESEYAQLYAETMDYLFDRYNDLVKRISACVRNNYPKDSSQSDTYYESICKARTCDICRYILPAGTLTNLGMTANARSFEYAISKFLSSDLEELNSIGQKIKKEVQKIIPTLVKYADKNPYISETDKDMRQADEVTNTHHEKTRPVILVAYEEDAYDRVVTSILYKYSQASYLNTKEKVKKLEIKEKEKILDSYFSKLGKHDRPMRELEHIYYTFDILVDFGAFRDIQRHRICTQTTQDLTTLCGYDIPQEITDSGYNDLFVACMKKADSAFKKISRRFPKEAQYVVPLAYKKRVLFTWNLRELFHFIKLRSSKEGHISYRKIAWECYDEIEKVHPLFAKYLVVDKSLKSSR